MKRPLVMTGQARLRRASQLKNGLCQPRVIPTKPVRINRQQLGGGNISSAVKAHSVTLRRMDVSDILSPLNTAQREAVTASSGNLLVLAGAGSGKTSVSGASYCLVDSG
jgi:hypothetical protein